MSFFHINSYGHNNKDVVFLLPGWHNKAWMFWIYAKILEFNGYCCLIYEYNDEVLSPNTGKTVDSLTTIRDDILKKISNLEKQGKDKFIVFGSSLGSVIALMVANKSSEITHVILNTVGEDVAQTIWSWDKIFPYFKKNLIKQGFTLAKLQTAWKEIAPKNNIDNLTNKKILIYLSRKDEVIPFFLGENLVHKLKNKKYSCVVIVNRYLNHLLTGLYNLLNAKVYLQFLRS